MESASGDFAKAGAVYLGKLGEKWIKTGEARVEKVTEGTKKVAEGTKETLRMIMEEPSEGRVKLEAKSAFEGGEAENDDLLGRLVTKLSASQLAGRVKAIWHGDDVEEIKGAVAVAMGFLLWETVLSLVGAIALSRKIMKWVKWTEWTKNQNVPVGVGVIAAMAAHVLLSELPTSIRTMLVCGLIAPQGMKVLVQRRVIPAVTFCSVIMAEGIKEIMNRPGRPRPAP